MQGAVDKDKEASIMGNKNSNQPQGNNAPSSDGESSEDIQSDRNDSDTSQGESSTEDEESSDDSDGSSDDEFLDILLRRDGVDDPQSEYIPPCSSIPLVLNNPHILLKGKSIEDPTVTKTLLNRLMMILHSKLCITRRRESLYVWLEHCSIRGCDFMRLVLEHLENCDDHNCQRNGCQNVRVILGHWDHCAEKQKCNLCGTLLRAMRRMTS